MDTAAAKTKYICIIESPVGDSFLYTHRRIWITSTNN